MSRWEFDRQLDSLRADIVALGEAVVERLTNAAEALETGEESLARSVVAGDDEVNKCYMGIERRCIDLFALRQPVASDLREVAGAYKISTDLERVGDLAVNVAEYALALERELYPEVPFDDLTEAAVRAVEDAVGTYAESGDAWRCHELADRDTELDAMCAHAREVVTRALLEREVVDADTGDVEGLVADVTTLMLVVRDIERVGDHAVNIAARTLYITESDDSLLE
ncbi:MAG: phosphate signaling complex protein PhoU [Haloarculaceae archaeon]